jgi:hypothetical protein
MRIPNVVLAATAPLILAAAQPAPAPTSPASSYTYADLADLALPAPVVLVATIVRTTSLKPELAPGLRPGHVRMLVEADAARLIRGPQGLAPRITYLADVPLDARGRAPKLRKSQVLLFARPVEGKPAMLQLTAPDAQLALTPGVEERTRAILTEAVAGTAPPRVTGIGGAFHVPGVLPGESETQIFLTTARRQPISLTVLRRPGETPRWAVALGEIVDEAATPPAPETLLWYRLACGLPSSLPDRALAELGPDGAQAARADYQFVLEQLGACARTRTVTRS